MIIALTIITTIVLIKFKPIYAVTIGGEQVGYVQNKAEFERLVEDEIINKQGENIAFTDLTDTPKYELILANKETNEDEIFSRIEQTAITTYRVYAIATNDEIKNYVNSKEEAEIEVERLKEEYKQTLGELNITVQEIYTEDLQTLGQTVETAAAVTQLEDELTKQVQIIQARNSATIDGVYFSCTPVSGHITSRYGVNESVRDHTHGGLDIAVPNGTPIKAAAEGTIYYASQMGGYGNLVIIDHGNGIQSYYGHCSKLYVSKGQKVNAGDTIAAVGSTGNSTGNHLHFEIRKNGNRINPQKYLYK